MAASYQKNKIAWLAVIWGLLVAIAVGLLVGLLVHPAASPAPLPPTFGADGSLGPNGTAAPYSADFQAGAFLMDAQTSCLIRIPLPAACAALPDGP